MQWNNYTLFIWSFNQGWTLELKRSQHWNSINRRVLVNSLESKSKNKNKNLDSCISTILWFCIFLAFSARDIPVKFCLKLYVMCSCNEDLKALSCTIKWKGICVFFLHLDILPHLKHEFCTYPCTPAAFWNNRKGDSRWRFLIILSYQPDFQG